MNSITDLLDLEDSNIVISDIRIEGTTKVPNPGNTTIRTVLPAVWLSDALQRNKETDHITSRASGWISSQAHPKATTLAMHKS